MHQAILSCGTSLLVLHVTFEQYFLHIYDALLLMEGVGCISPMCQNKSMTNTAYGLNSNLHLDILFSVRTSAFAFSKKRVLYCS